MPALAYNEDGGTYAGMGIDFNDYDNDGRPDVIITNLAKELYALYRNDKSGYFSYRTRQTYLARITNFLSGWGVRFFDYDHDGWKDLFVAQSHVLDNVERMDPTIPYLQPPLLVRNDRGKFTDVSSESGAIFSKNLAGRGAAFGDLDNDGDIDIVVGVLGDYPAVLYSNASSLPRHWLEIKLIGTTSNRDGQGAKLHIRSPSGRRAVGLCHHGGKLSVGKRRQSSFRPGRGSPRRKTRNRVAERHSPGTQERQERSDPSRNRTAAGHRPLALRATRRPSPAMVCFYSSVASSSLSSSAILTMM